LLLNFECVLNIVVYLPQDRPLSQLKATLLILLTELSKKVQSILLLTVPPLLNYANDEERWEKQLEFNNWIKGQEGMFINIREQVVD
jgi:hypothetical protein